jgi:hypothetical protein
MPYNIPELLEEKERETIWSRRPFWVTTENPLFDLMVTKRSFKTPTLVTGDQLRWVPETRFFLEQFFIKNHSYSRDLFSFLHPAIRTIETLYTFSLHL